MIIKASRRSALMVVTGLFVCVAGVSYTGVSCEAASSKSESVSATKSVKHGTRYGKRYSHRKYVRSAQRSSPAKRADEKQIADATGALPDLLPPVVANANARVEVQLDEPTGAARAMTERANAILMAQADTKPAATPAAVPAPEIIAGQLTPPDQLSEADRSLQEKAQAPQAQAPQAQVPASSQTVAMATTVVKAGAGTPAAAITNDSSSWDEASLIGKIFIAFGALLTIASAARMFMA